MYVWSKVHIILLLLFFSFTFSDCILFSLALPCSRSVSLCRSLFWLFFSQKEKKIHYQHFRKWKVPLYFTIFLYNILKNICLQTRKHTHTPYACRHCCYFMACYCRIRCINEFFVFRPIISTYFSTALDSQDVVVFQAWMLTERKFIVFHFISVG